MAKSFLEMLGNKWEEGKFVCVGLDSDYERIPETMKERLMRKYRWGIENKKQIMYEFNIAIIEATADLVCAYKPNIAFYEREGIAGISALIETVAYIRIVDSNIPVILDAKRADIGNTNKGYVEAAFDSYEVDAITVHPFLGQEALKPFLEQKDKGIIVLCRTSNPGAGEFQDLVVEDGMLPLYQIVAYRVAKFWNYNSNCAVVVGATYPEELEEVRGIVGDIPILIPGIGKQGGDIEKTVKAGINSKKQGIIINSSRGIIFASSGSDFAQAAREKTVELDNVIRQFI